MIEVAHPVRPRSTAYGLRPFNLVTMGVQRPYDACVEEAPHRDGRQRTRLAHRVLARAARHQAVAGGIPFCSGLAESRITGGYLPFVLYFLPIG